MPPSSSQSPPPWTPQRRARRALRLRTFAVIRLVLDIVLDVVRAALSRIGTTRSTRSLPGGRSRRRLRRLRRRSSVGSLMPSAREELVVLLLEEHHAEPGGLDLVGDGEPLRLCLGEARLERLVQVSHRVLSRQRKVVVAVAARAVVCREALRLARGHELGEEVALRGEALGRDAEPGGAEVPARVCTVLKHRHRVVV